MTATLEPARAGNTDLLATMMREYYACDGLHFDEDVARRAIATLLGDPALGRAYLIIAGGEPVGYTYLTSGYSLEFAGRFALVDELYIREAFRGQGMGAAVMRQLEEHCAVLGFTAIRLEVEIENVGAQRLYKRLGFNAHERHLMTKWLKGEG